MRGVLFPHGRINRKRGALWVVMGGASCRRRRATGKLTAEEIAGALYRERGRAGDRQDLPRGRQAGKPAICT